MKSNLIGINYSKYQELRFDLFKNFWQILHQEICSRKRLNTFGVINLNLRAHNSGGLGASGVELGLVVVKCGWVVLDSLALVKESTEVLHGVRIWLAASIPVKIDQVAVAVKLVAGGWQWVILFLNLVNEVGEDALKGLVGPESVLQLLFQSLLVLNRWVSDDFGVEVVKIDVSDVNGEIVLLGNLLGGVAQLLLQETFANRFESRPHVLWCGVLTSLELTDHLRGNGEVTPLKNVGLGGLLTDKAVLSVKCLRSKLLSSGSFVSVLHPVGGEKITKTRSNGDTVDLIVWVAVSTERALLSIGGRDSIDINVLSEDVFEDRTGLTSFHINDHLLVHFVLVHVLKNLIELIGEHEEIRHSHNTWTTVISVIEEDLRVLVGLQNLFANTFITSEDTHDLLPAGLVTLVVNLAALIDVDTLFTVLGGLVEKFSLEWVVRRVGYIIIRDHDDLVLWNTILSGDMVSVAAISLMSVVLETIGADNDDSPMILGRVFLSLSRSSGQSTELNKFLEHFIS